MHGGGHCINNYADFFFHRIQYQVDRQHVLPMNHCSPDVILGFGQQQNLILNKTVKKVGNNYHDRRCLECVMW